MEGVRPGCTGKNAYSRDRQRIADNAAEPEVAARLARATWA